MHPFMGGFGWLILFVLLAIVVLVVWLVVSLSRGDSNRTYKRDNTDALDIARERYAKGEIDEAEFNKIKKNLS